MYNHAYTETHKYRPTHIYTDRHMKYTPTYIYAILYRDTQLYNSYIHTQETHADRHTQQTQTHTNAYIHIHKYIHRHSHKALELLYVKDNISSFRI